MQCCENFIKFYLYKWKIFKSKIDKRKNLILRKTKVLKAQGLIKAHEGKYTEVKFVNELKLKRTNESLPTNVKIEKKFIWTKLQKIL